MINYNRQFRYFSRFGSLSLYLLFSVLVANCKAKIETDSSRTRLAGDNEQTNDQSAGDSSPGPKEQLKNTDQETDAKPDTETNTPSPELPPAGLLASPPLPPEAQDPASPSPPPPNNAPTIAITGLTGSANFIEIGTSVSITWTDVDAEDDAEINLYLTSSNTGACSQGTQIGSTISEDDETDLYAWDSSSVSDGKYYFCASIDDGTNAAVEVYSDPVLMYPAGVCVWNGLASHSWADGANWYGCIGAPDTATEWVLIMGSVTPQPSITANTTIAGFASGNGGGAVSIAPGIKLTLKNTASTIQSSVAFVGTVGGAKGIVEAEGNLYVVNNATLTLNEGIQQKIEWNYWGYIGTASSLGHLVIDSHGQGEDDWALIKTSGFIVNAPSGLAKSSVSINEVSGELLYSRSLFVFQDNFQIKKFDSVKIIGGHLNFTSQSFIILKNCANGQILDSSWDGINFAMAPFSEKLSNAYNIDASANCPTFGTPILVSGSGPGFASYFENDPNGSINWLENSTTPFVCEFTNIGGNNSWDNPGNWANCNDRSGVPDVYDTAFVPAGRSVTVDEITIIQALRGGSGGGTITIASDSALMLADAVDTVKSSIIVQGATAATNAMLQARGNLSIVNGSRLTVGENLRISLLVTDWSTAGKISVGDGVTGGEFYTLSGMNLSNKPSLAMTGTSANYAYDYSSIVVAGASGSKSKISIEGFSIGIGGSTKKRPFINFQGNYEIVALDNLNLGGVLGASHSQIKLSDCTSGTFTDLNWDNLVLGSLIASSFNIDASGTGCSAIGPINLTGSGPGYDANYDNDPLEAGSDVIIFN